MFVWLFGVRIWCAFGVVRHADALADILGEPYGTLILTISVISIEVAILATIMLGKTPNPTLPRETMFAILMIVLNGMVGTVLAVGGLRYVQQQYNLQGALAYLAAITPLAFLALVVPTITESTSGPTLQTQQAIFFGGMTELLYGAFLTIQTTRYRTFFAQPKSARRDKAEPQTEADKVPEPDTGMPDSGHHGPVYSGPVHALLLLATLLPVVLLSKPLATILDHGIALSTIGRTLPVMLAISLFTGTPLRLGLYSVDIVLLSVTLFVCHITFSGAPTNILLGLVHLVLFPVYLILIFKP